MVEKHERERAERVWGEMLSAVPPGALAGLGGCTGAPQHPGLPGRASALPPERLAGLHCQLGMAHTLTPGLSHPNLPQQQHSELAVCRARAIPKGLRAGAGAPTGAGSCPVPAAATCSSPQRGFCSLIQPVPRVGSAGAAPTSNHGLGWHPVPAALPREQRRASPSLPPAFLFLNLFGSFIKATEQFRGVFFPSPLLLCGSGCNLP